MGRGLYCTVYETGIKYGTEEKWKFKDEWEAAGVKMENELWRRGDWTNEERLISRKLEHGEEMYNCISKWRAVWEKRAPLGEESFTGKLYERTGRFRVREKSCTRARRALKGLSQEIDFKKFDQK